MGKEYKRPFGTNIGLVRGFAHDSAYRDHMMLKEFGGVVRISEKIPTEKPPPARTQPRQESKPALV